MKTKRRRPQNRMVTRDGSLHVLRKGLPRFSWSDLYHLLLNLSWPKFLGLIAGGYVFTNVLFALAYLIEGNGIANAKPGNFLDAYFFSVQTMASIGYGALYPQTVYANTLVSIEALLGLMGLSMATGLMFTRFTRATAKVRFTNVALIYPYDEVPTLIFRVANERKSWILEAQIRVTMVKSEVNKEGHFMRRFYDLSLTRSDSPLFSLSWTVMHPIDRESPLYGMTPEMMIDEEIEIVVMLTGIDETLSQTIHARHSFVPQEILWNVQFVDIMSRTSEGKICIDYSRFHDVTPLY